MFPRITTGKTSISREGITAQTSAVEPPAICRETGTDYISESPQRQQMHGNGPRTQTHARSHHPCAVASPCSSTAEAGPGTPARAHARCLFVSRHPTPQHAHHPAPANPGRVHSATPTPFQHGLPLGGVSVPSSHDRTSIPATPHDTNPEARARINPRQPEH